MRKVLFILLLFACIVCNAQEHMKFLGVSMECTQDRFQKEMLGKGFHYVEALNDHMIHLKGGVFAGKENADMIIGSTQKSHRVAVVLVWFNDYPDDESIAEAFKTYLMLFQYKYGNSEKAREGDHGLYRFVTDKGPIGLYTQPARYGMMSGCFFRYSDSINCKLAIQEASEGI